MNFKHNMCADLEKGCQIAKLEPGDIQSLLQSGAELQATAVRGPVIVHGFCKAFKHRKYGEKRGSLQIAQELVLYFLRENLSRFRIMWIYAFFPVNIYLMETAYNAILEHDVNGSVPLSHSFLEHYSRVPKDEEDYCKEMLPTFHALMARSNF